MSIHISSKKNFIKRRLQKFINQPERLRDASRQSGVEPLETRIAPAAVANIDLSSLNGENGGFKINGVPASGAGFSVGNAGDVNGDGFDDLIIGAPSATVQGAAYAGTSYVVFGHAATFPDALELSRLDGTNGGFQLNTGGNYDQAGFSVSGAGDFNGDGFDDLLISAPFASYDASSYLVFGKASGFANVNLSILDGTNGGFKLRTGNSGSYPGSVVKAAGDINGDGFDDVIIGITYSEPQTESSKDQSYVVFGKKSGFATIDLSVLDGTNGGFKLNAGASGEVSNISMSGAGDFNGDGFKDLIIGIVSQTYSDGGVFQTGRSYVVFGKMSGFENVKLDALDGSNGGFLISDSNENDLPGRSVSSAGDINGDGFDDVIIGGASTSSDYSGNAQGYVIFGHASNFAEVDLSTLDGSNGGFTLYSGTQFIRAGFSVSGAGDLNGDGFDDLIIGAPDGSTSSTTYHAGQSFVVFGKAAAFTTIDLSSLNGKNGFTLSGGTSGAQSGWSVSRAGDVNGDGFDDLIIGSYYHISSDYQEAGGSDPDQTYVVFGFDTDSVTHPGTGNSDTLSGAVGADVIIGGGAGDFIHGNGGADVLRGGEGRDSLGISSVNFKRIEGGTGVDTLVLEGTAGLMLDLTAIRDNRITGIEQIDLAGPGHHVLTLNAHEVLALSDHSNTLIVNRGSDDTVVMGPGWLSTGSQVRDGHSYRVYTQGEAVLQVEQVPASPSDLSITSISDGIDTTRPGAVVNYTISYLNQGTASATGVTIIDKLPAGTTFDARANSGWVQSGGNLVFRFSDPLAPNESGKVNLVLGVADPAANNVSFIINTAIISDDGQAGQDFMQDNNTATDIDVLGVAVQFDVSSVLNADVIINRHNGVTDSIQESVDLVNVGGNFAILTQSAGDFITGYPQVSRPNLPDNGFFAANASHPEVRLSYNNTDDGNNVVKQLSSGAIPFTFDVPNLLYSEVNIFATSGNGQSRFHLIFEYADETTSSTAQVIVRDWFDDPAGGSAYYLIDGLDRSHPSGNITGDYEASADPAIFGFTFATDPHRQLSSITVVPDSIQGTFVFFGSMGVATTASSPPSTVTIAKISDGAETNTPIPGKFRVTQSAMSLTDTVVNYTIGGTATAGTDYSALSGTVTILAGQTVADIDVMVLNDIIVEGVEALSVTLSSLGAHDPAVTLGSALSASLDITDDDTAAITIAKINDGAETGTPAPGKFRVTQSAVSSTDTVVNYTVGGTAAAGSDYSALSGTVTILAGKTAADINVTVLNDAIVEGSETVTATLSSLGAHNSAITVGSALSASLDITDDDTAAVTIAKIGDGAETGTPTPGKFRVTQSAVSSTDTVVNYTVSGTAAAGSDYSALSGTVTILAGQTAADIDVTVLNDTIVEGIETVAATLSSLGAHNPAITLGSTLSASLNITDDDTATVTIAKINDGAETNTPTPGKFRVTQSAVSSTDTIVNYTVGGTAAAGSDYSALSGTVTILAGQTAADINVTVLNDNLSEAVETVIVTLNSFASGDPDLSLPAAFNTAALSISDNDVDLKLTIAESIDPVVAGSGAGNLTYIVKLENIGQVDATGVAVSEDLTLPAGAILESITASSGVFLTTLPPDGSWTLDLERGAQATLTIVLDVSSSTLAGKGAIGETAAITGARESLVNTGDDTAAESTSIRNEADVSVVQSHSPAPIIPGQSLAYTITVHNSGPSDAKGVAVADMFSSVLSNVIYTAVQEGGASGYSSGSGNLSQVVSLPAGSTITYTVNGIVNAAATGTLSNTATAALPGDVFDANAANNSSTNVDALIPHTDLQITQTDNKTSAVPGTSNTYTVVITNAGPSDATGVTVEDYFHGIPVPAFGGTNYIATGTGGSSGFVNGSGDIYQMVNMPAGSTITYVVTGNISPAVTGTLVNTAMATAAAGSVDDNLANNKTADTDILTPQTDLAITLFDSPDPVFPGSTLTYIIRVSNSGPSDANGAMIIDNLPQALSFVQWSAVFQGGAAGKDSGAGNISEIISVPIGATIVYTITGTAGLTAAGTTILNTATIEAASETQLANNTDSAPTYVYGSDLKLAKSDNVTTTTPGSTLAYKLNYSNTGYSIALGVVLTEHLPAGSSFNPGASTAGWMETAPASGVFTFAIGKLDIGQSGSADFAVDVNGVAAAGVETVVNLASITDDGSFGPDLNPGDNMAADSDALDAAPDLLIVKTSDSTIAKRGGVLHYTLHYSNIGNQDSTGAYLVENLPLNTTFDAVGSDSRWTLQDDGSYRLDLGNSPVGIDGSAVSFAAKVLPVLPGGTRLISNLVQISDDGLNGIDLNPANNTSSVVASVNQGIYAVSTATDLIGICAKPVVRVFDAATNLESFKFKAYSSHRDGVRLAIGDINGDGIDDIVTASSFGSGQVRVFDGLTGKRLQIGDKAGSPLQLNPFDGKKEKGAYVASGDVNGDGRDDIIVGSGANGGTIKVYSGKTGGLLGSYLAFSKSFKGGVSLALGDVSGDGIEDIIASEATSGGTVMVYKGVNGELPAALELLASFEAGGGSYRGGVTAAAADLDGDGKADVIIGRSSGAPSAIEIYSGADSHLINTILPFDSSFKNGVRVAAVDVNFDGIADVIAGGGSRSESQVMIFDGKSILNTGTPATQINQFTAFSRFPNIALVVAGSSPEPSIRGSIKA